MRKLTLTTVILLTLCSVNHIFAQEFESVTKDDEPVFKHTWVTGGGLGLQFGSVTMVDISPQVGYFVNEYLVLGLGGTYQYVNDRRISNYSFKTNVYGGSLFGRFYMPFFKSIFLHAQYEYLAYNTNSFNLYNYGKDEYEWLNVQNVLVGAGYRQLIAGRSALNIMVLWNLNETEYSLYQNPVIRIGFDIGL